MARLVALALGLGAGLLLLTVAPSTAQQLPPADTAWRYRAAADIAFFRSCPEDELLLATRKAVLALDAGTGQPLWALTDLPSVSDGLYWGPCDATTAISYRRDRIVAFDVPSGRLLWDASSLLPFREVRGYVTLNDRDLLLLFLRTAASDRSLAAVRLSTGALQWIRDDLFPQSPRFAGRDGVSDISEYQVVIADSDTTLLLYLSADGPARLDGRTGMTLWRTEALAGMRVPAVSDYAAMVVVDSVLVVPRDRGLLGLDTRTGAVVWERPDLLPGHATRLRRVPSGLLVRAGGAHLVVLDAAMGEPRWAPALTVPTDGVAYEIVEDRYYVVARDRLLAADLATGDTLGLATLAFSGGEHAELMYGTEEGIVVASRQNLFRVTPAGEVVYHRYYPAPGATFLEKLAGAVSLNVGVLGARFGAAAFRTEYAYFLTNAPDADGRTGNSLVRVALEDGTERGRIWFRSRAPVFRPDTPRDQLLVLEDDRTLVALRFTAAQVSGPMQGPW